MKLIFRKKSATRRENTFLVVQTIVPFSKVEKYLSGLHPVWLTPA
jgi:hypothetical protein